MTARLRSIRKSGRTPAWGATLLALPTILALLAGAGSAPAHAGSNTEARLALHLLPTTAKNGCGAPDATPACSNIVTQGGLLPATYFAFLLVTDGDAAAGISGLQCGLAYDGAPHSGVDIFQWVNCATLEFPSGGWPAAGSGNLITWDNTVRCQRNEPGGAGTGVVAAAGYFYLAAYSPDFLQLTTRPADGQVRVADCSNVESILEEGGVHHVPSVLGAIYFSAGGSTPGYNPCGPNPVMVDCTIDGPDVVPSGSTDNLYTVPSAPMGASYAWTVTGPGFIQGSATGATLSVQAGTPGSYTVRVIVTASGSSSGCSKSTTVESATAPTCSIAGPNTLTSGTGAHYTVTASAPITSVTWTISGDGAIYSGIHGTGVDVGAGGEGAFTLTATVHTSTSPTDAVCSRTVTVTGPPPALCVINGPDPVAAGLTGITYSVNIPLATITSADWTISGDGVITSDPHQTSIMVQAGAVGAYQLSVAVQTTGTPSSGNCNRTITVVAAPPASCTISGPDLAHPGTTGLTYSVIPGGGTLLDVHWTISGNGTITSDPNQASVTVDAGALGAFDLAATLHTDDTPLVGSCSKSVTVTDEQTGCTISGPDPVSEGSPDLVYAMSPGGPVASVAWSLTGNGAIISGLTSTSVHVRAGDPGAFELTATLTGPLGGVTHCTRLVTVNTLGCAISGSGPVPGGSTGLVYSTGPALFGATYLWQITGNATISGSAQNASVIVNAGPSGSFSLVVSITRNQVTHTCGRAVTITSGTGGATQNDAKLLIHLAPSSGNAPCAIPVPACAAIRTNGALFPTTYFAYLLVTDGNAAAGVAGLQCGISYDAAAHSGVDIFSWTRCATLEFPSAGPNGPWPAAGSGNLITWDAASVCQRTEPGGPGTGVVANAGYFYLAAYSPGVLAVTPRPVDGQAKVADCAASESLIGGTGYPAVPSHLGFAAFSASGGSSGYNPCGGALLPVRMTTWSGIKALYREAHPAVPPR